MQQDILFSEIAGRGGNLGVVTLNRARALNALTQTMCVMFDQQLAAWEKADHIKAVVVKSSSEKAFCAGGDIRCIYDAAIKGDRVAQYFFRDEYRLNHRIHHYSKPYIALLNGITMGGGVGISIHGSHRIATENALFAMPETGIGFFPDIGSSYFLPRFSGRIGFYLGLTGARIKNADAVYAGFATHFISSHHIDDCIPLLAKTDLPGDGKHAVSEALQEFSIGAGVPPLNEYRTQIDECFAQPTIEKIIEQLSARSENEWCNLTLKTLATKSPTSLKVTLKQLQLGEKLDFDKCMEMEYGLAQHFFMSHDFTEGVRAVVVDKDHSPKWSPAELNQISDESVNKYFMVEKRDSLFPLER